MIYTYLIIWPNKEWGGGGEWEWNVNLLKLNACMLAPAPREVKGTGKRKG